MRIGIRTGQTGRLARPAAIRAMAVAAEQVGYSSVWAVDGELLDPVGVLAATAAVTSRVGLGASLRVALGDDPARLALPLATLDLLSEGRLTVALAGDTRAVAALADALSTPVRLGDGWMVEAVLTDRPLDIDRPRFHGSAEQIAADIEALDADEVVLGLRGDLGLDETLDGYARIAEAGDLEVYRIT